MIDNMKERDKEVLKLLYRMAELGPYRSFPSYTTIKEFKPMFPVKNKPSFVPDKLLAPATFVADGLPPQIGTGARGRT